MAYATPLQRAIGGGKGRVRHKCPHGNWCIFGHPLAGREGRNWPDCTECLIERRREAGLETRRA